MAMLAMKVTVDLAVSILHVAYRRAHQLGVARLALEALAGEHAAELAQKATEVAYLSSMMGLTNDLLSTKQRWGCPLHGSWGCCMSLACAQTAGHAQSVRMPDVLHACDMGAAVMGCGEAANSRPPASELFRQINITQCLAQVKGEEAFAYGFVEDVLHGKGRRFLCRKVQELSGEIAGLQDVLSEAGAEEVSQAMRMKELDIQVRQQRQQLSLVCTDTSPESCPTQWRPCWDWDLRTIQMMLMQTSDLEIGIAHWQQHGAQEGRLHESSMS